MPETMSKWNDYSPSKTVWFWSCAGACLLTVILGFTWGGWVTGGTAQERVEAAGEHAAAVAGSSASASFSAQSSAAPSTGSSAAAKVVQPASWTRSSRDQRLSFLSSVSLAPASGAARKR